MKNVDLNHSNMLNESQHNCKKITMSGFLKSNSPDKVIKLADGGDEFLLELKGSKSSEKLYGQSQILTDLYNEDSFDIIEIIMNKFNSKKEETK